MGGGIIRSAGVPTRLAMAHSGRLLSDLLMNLRSRLKDEELLKDQRLKFERRMQLGRVQFEIKYRGKSDIFGVLADNFSPSGSADVRQHLYSLTNYQSVRDWLRREAGVPKRLLSEKNLCAYTERWIRHLLSKDPFFAEPTAWERAPAHTAQTGAARPDPKSL